MTDQPPGIPAVQMAYPDPQWQSGRWIDPVRAAALHEAVQIVSAAMGEPRDVHSLLSGRQPLDFVEEAAERFEAWLAGPEAE